MIITVASGKGGTGKTTVAVNLALALCDSVPVQFIDADVEAPNAHLFLHPVLDPPQRIDKLLPVIDEDACQLCGECSQACEFNAIAQLGPRVIVYPTLCHGCGRCRLVCRFDAISEVSQPLGVVQAGQSQGMAYVEGRLNIGEAMSTPIIHALRDRIDPSKVCVIDAPPGTGCPAIAAMAAADVVLLVTEPTPFGLHDLRAAVAVARTLKRSMAVVVNREGIGDDTVDRYCSEEGIPVLLRMAFSREIAAAYAVGQTLLSLDVRWKDRFLALFATLSERSS